MKSGLYVAWGDAQRWHSRLHCGAQVTTDFRKKPHLPFDPHSVHFGEGDNTESGEGGGEEGKVLVLRNMICNSFRLQFGSHKPMRDV